MLGIKTRIVVGLTTYYNENLMISLSGLSRLGRHFTLVIHNDNPNTKLTRRHVRSLGYHGPLHIINAAYNVGLCRSRLAILDFIRRHNKSAQWIVFTDDDDMLLNLDIPNVSPDNFAVIQNMVVLRTRLIDVLRVMHEPNNFTVDNENIYLVRPHIGLAGTLVRASVMLRMGVILNELNMAISDIDAGLSFRPPVDMMMWSALNIIAHHDNASATPIYMDRTNYLATDLDTATTKYGMNIIPPKNASAAISRAIARYDNAVRTALASNAAAPSGLESGHA